MVSDGSTRHRASRGKRVPVASELASDVGVSRNDRREHGSVVGDLALGTNETPRAKLTTLQPCSLGDLGVLCVMRAVSAARPAERRGLLDVADAQGNGRRNVIQLALRHGAKQLDESVF
jgi:hypothetical protein